jgi:hypothetical protein
MHECALFCAFSSQISGLTFLGLTNFGVEDWSEVSESRPVASRRRTRRGKRPQQKTKGRTMARRGASNKAIERARAAAASARKKARESREVLERKAFVAGGSYALGMAQRAGLLDKLPGPNKHLMAAIGAGVAGMFVKGTAGRALDATSDAALAVYVHGLATGARVAGVGASSPQLSAAEIERRLEAAIDRIEGLDDDDEEIGIDDDEEIGIDDEEEVVEGVLVGADDLID